MRRALPVLASFQLLVQLCPPARLIAQDIDLGTVVTVHAETRGDSLGFSAPARDIEIDESIRIEWNEATLLRELGRSLELLATGDPLGERIDILRYLTDQFLQSQTALVEFVEAASALEDARLQAAPDTAEREAERDSASNRFSRIAGAALDTLMDGERMKQAFGAAGAEALLEAGDEAVLGGSYQALVDAIGRFLEPELEELSDQLTARVGEGRTIRVYMSAWISSSGATRRLHLDGYDDLQTGEPIPFPRFQVAMSERTQRELESAQQFQAIVESPEVLKAELEAAVRAVRVMVTSLTQAIGTDVLQRALARLELDLAGADSVLIQVREARRAVEALSSVPEVDTADDMALLLTLVGRFEIEISRLLTAVATGGPILSRLADTLRARISAPTFPAEVHAAVIEALEATAAALRDDHAVQQIVDRIRGVATTLGLTRRVLDGGRAVNAVARRVDSNTPLDTFLDLKTAGERHPGDRVDVRARVVLESADGRQSAIAQARHTVRLRVRGFYVETRGVLMFTDPRSRRISGSSFEPTLGLSYLAHYGWMDQRFWNDFLNPGVGLAVALLDHDPRRDFELGLAATVSLFRDLVHVGYGRNLQAQAGFFYIGFTPRVLGELRNASGF